MPEEREASITFTLESTNRNLSRETSGDMVRSDCKERYWISAMVVEKLSISKVKKTKSQGKLRKPVL